MSKIILTPTIQASVPTPSAGKVVMFVDSLDGILKTKDEAGLVKEVKGEKGDTGDAGVSILWQGSQASAPLSPQLNWGYYNTSDGISYIWNGSSWDIIAQDGVGGVAEVETTLANLVTLVNTSSLVEGTVYVITDHATTDFYQLIKLYIKATTTKTLSPVGYLNMYVSDFQNVGSYTNPTPPVAFSSPSPNKSTWTLPPMSIAVGDVVIYKNKHYINLLGAVGSAPDGDATNWTFLPFDVENGYLVETLECGYDISANTTDGKIRYLKDKRNNILYNNIPVLLVS